MTILPESFYQSEDVVGLSKLLLGKVLRTDIGGELCLGRIVETEAYRAPDDKACHAYQNKRTPRTETMFSKGGVSYVYICYGIHHLFNIVTGPEGAAHAVLVRAIEPVSNIATFAERRKMKENNRAITNGPGKFTVAMGIYKEHDGLSLFDQKSVVSVWDDSYKVKESEIVSGPRVGMSTAEECSHWPWRFRIKDNPWTSKPDIVKYDF